MATPLVLVVAFPRLPVDEVGSEPRRCGPEPRDSDALGGSASRALVAWGQLYVDQGDQRDLAAGTHSGFVNFRAEAQPDGTGILTGTFSATGAPRRGLLCRLVKVVRLWASGQKVFTGCTNASWWVILKAALSLCGPRRSWTAVAS
jgi:hypothetical protein